VTHTPQTVRAWLATLPALLSLLKADPASAQKGSAYSVLLSYGVLREGSVAESDGQRLSVDAATMPAGPLTFTEKTSYNAWFLLHPKKVCGEQKLTSSREFPVTIVGQRADIERAIWATTRAKKQATLTVEQRMKTAKAKMRMLRLRLQLEAEATAKKSSGLGFLGTLSGLSGLDGLGVLPETTKSRIADNEAAIAVLLDEQQKGRTYKKGDTLSFEDIINQYNPGLTREEIIAWVWYKRTIGVPMTGWDTYFLKAQKATSERVVTVRPNADPSRQIDIRDNHFRVVGQVAPGTVLGRATSKKLQYDKDTVYVIAKLNDTIVPEFPAGSMVYVNEREVIVDKPADNVDQAELIKLVKGGYLFYHDGRLMPYPMYAYGNMYDRELQLAKDTDVIREKFGEDALSVHRAVVQQARPKLISVQNADPRERPKILIISDFAENFTLTKLSDDSGVDLQKEADRRHDANRRGRNADERAALSELEQMRGEDGVYTYTLPQAFIAWLKSLPASDFVEVSAAQIISYYIYAQSMGRSMSEAQKDTIGKYAPLEGEALFARFLHEALAYEDKQKVDFSWNRLYNAYSSVPHHRVPVGFTCSAFFKRSLLQFTPAQREAIAFMEVAGSGVLAYDVGVGKTLAAIITLANSLYSGKCKRPIIAVPNPTYAKWMREIIGYQEGAEFVPGVLSHTGITINDWSNLGKETRARKDVALDKLVDEKSITLVTFEGLMKLGYGRKVMEELFDELSKILAQERHNDKSARDLEKIYQTWRAFIGISNKGSVADIDALGFDYLVIDEAHNFKNIFDQVPVDENGKKRFNITGSQSDRGVKAFFLTNYIQRKFGQNVLLLTATPFTNSPLEIYSMLSMVGYNTLKKMGITSLEAFCETFVLQSLEYVNNYRGEIVLDNVVKSYNNRLVLQRLIHNHIAYKTGEEAGVKRPVKINLPRLVATGPDGALVKLPPAEQIVTYLRPTDAQRENQQRIESLAARGGESGKQGLAVIGKALGQSLDNALSPYLYKENADQQPTFGEFVENSPKLNYVCQCIKSVKLWHEARKEPVSGQVIYMNRGKDFFPFIKQYLESEAGYKQNIKFAGRTFDEIEFITSEVSADRKEAIKDAFLAGKVLVIIGTATIKEGIDLQINGSTLYNLYPDWNPTDIKQLEGRIWRQGNRFGYVRCVMPLVQDTMDVFVFQKLEEKTARINDIWYRADRGNVLDQESLDPMEIKFALFSDASELLKVKVDQLLRELKRKQAVAEADIDAINRFAASYRAYLNYQTQCRTVAANMPNVLQRNLQVWEQQEQVGFSTMWWVKALTHEQRKALKASMVELLADAQQFNTTDLDDKVLIRLLDRMLKTIERFKSKTGDYFKLETILSEFRQRLSEVRKTERTLLVPRGLSATDNLDALQADLQGNLNQVEADIARLRDQTYLLELRDEIVATKAKSSVAGGSASQRADDFARLNYLLGYKAGDVPATASGLPNENAAPAAAPVAPTPTTAPALPAARAAMLLPPGQDTLTDADKNRKIKIAKAKMRMLRLRLQLELQQQATHKQAA
jgi:hypothetical protein